MDGKRMQEQAEALRAFWIARTNKIEDWYRLRMRYDYNARDEYESVVTNDPKTFFNLAQYMISAIPARHNIPVKADSEREMERKSISERGLMSLWREQDMKQFRRGRRPWRWELADYMLITGWYAVYVDVLEIDGALKFYADVLDPKHVYQEWDEDGLLRCVVDKQMSYASAYNMVRGHVENGEQGWEIPPFLENAMEWSAHESVTVTQVWSRAGSAVYQGVLAGSEVVKNDSWVEGLSEIPIITGPAAGEAAWGGYGSGDSNWTERYGESVLEPNAEMYEEQNKNLTRLAQIVEDYAIPPVLDKNEGGRALVGPEDVKGGRIIHIDKDGTVEFIRPPNVPKEFYNYLSVVEQKVQQGSVPYTLYGSVPAAMDLSGFAIGLLMTAAQNVIASYKAAMGYVMRTIDYNWLEGFRNSGVSKIAIAGKARASDSGSLFFEDWKRRDVPECTYIDVTIPLATPSDLLERVTIARQAKPEGALLDDITLLEEVIQVEDTKLVKQRLDEEMFENTPQMRILRMVLEAKRKETEFRQSGDAELVPMAELLATFSAQMMAELGAAAGGQGNAPKPGASPEVGGSTAGGVPEQRQRAAGARR